MSNNIKIVSFKDEQVQKWIPEIAKLRIEVFAEYPFLYAGDLEYEKRYLQKFMTTKNAIIVCAFDHDTLVGISTGFPFVYETEDLQDIFKKKNRNPEDYFFFGESVLRKSHRGSGIGKAFFKEREAHVEALGYYRYICFYTALRPEDDPKRPEDYKPLGPFWKRLGYKKHLELTSFVFYQEIGEEKETPKKMVFWIKEL